ncbi:MAG: hypothetical protein MJ092_07570 [Lachnospiraceae bacterium]|nr:hypothetical protein [Lachnospiraceae bacterium]
MPEYKFGKSEDQLLRLCRANQPDYEKIQQRIYDGVDLNIVGEYGENILTAVYRYKEHGNNFPIITQLFINSGFDVKKYGLSCVNALVYSSYDKFIFLAAKLLLEAGADGDEKRWDSLLEAIGTEESYQRCCENNHECENIYYALYEIVDRAHKKLPYNDLELWDSFIGCGITSILSFSTTAESIMPIGRNKFSFPDKLYICSEDRVLVIEGNPNIYSRTNPFPEMEIDKCIPVDDLNSILGATVTSISFEHSEVSSGTTTYRQPIIFINLDNKMRVRFSTNFGEVPKGESVTYFEILK